MKRMTHSAYGRKVRVLTEEEIEKRYPKGNGGRRSKYTYEAIALGYNIALIEYEKLVIHDYCILRHQVEYAIQSLYPRRSQDHVKIWGYTDMSRLDQKKIYCAFKLREDAFFFEQDSKIEEE